MDATHRPISYKPEVIADASGKWAGNALRFATYEEAEVYVHDLARRWTRVTECRVIESQDPVSAQIVIDKPSRTFLIKYLAV